MPETPSKTQKGTDQRDFFRIDEEALLEFKPISKNHSDSIDADECFDDGNGSIELINQLKKIETESIQSLKILTDKNRLLGDFLKSLTKRIDIVARHVAFANEESLKTRPKTRISLSEDGIGFISDRTLYKGSYIALRIIFIPNYAVVTCYAEVVRCVTKDESFQIAAKFHQLHDKDRQTISRHILKSQVRARKQ